MWIVYETSDHGTQILPDRDSCDHYLDHLCLCVPTRRYITNVFGLGGSWVTTHNAWDGRERQERLADGTTFPDERADTLSVWVEGEMV